MGPEEDLGGGVTQCAHCRCWTVVHSVHVLLLLTESKTSQRLGCLCPLFVSLCWLLSVSSVVSLGWGASAKGHPIDSDSVRPMTHTFQTLPTHQLHCCQHCKSHNPLQRNCMPHPITWLTAAGGLLICVGGVWCIRVKITNLSRQQSGWKTPQHRKRKRKNTQPSSSSHSSLTRLNTCTGELTASFLPCVLFFRVKMCLFVFVWTEFEDYFD